MTDASGREDFVRRRVIYSGRVQGVGFRMTAVSIARRFPVSGYVKNLPDGTVEVVACGGERAVDEFLAEIAAAFEGYIDDIRQNRADSAEPFDGFGVRY